MIKRLQAAWKAFFQPSGTFVGTTTDDRVISRPKTHSVVAGDYVTRNGEFDKDYVTVLRIVGTMAVFVYCDKPETEQVMNVHFFEQRFHSVCTPNDIQAVILAKATGKGDVFAKGTVAHG